MSELEDYVLFAGVVEHGGFAPAGRAMRVPKSKLSRRVAGLEERLGVRLIERVDAPLSRHRGRADTLRAVPHDRARGRACPRDHRRGVF